jgi:hypothetical protein
MRFLKSILLIFFVLLVAISIIRIFPVKRQVIETFRGPWFTYAEYGRPINIVVERQRDGNNKKTLKVEYSYVINSSSDKQHLSIDNKTIFIKVSILWCLISLLSIVAGATIIVCSIKKMIKHTGKWWIKPDKLY